MPPVSALLNLPPELVEFSLRPPPRSLLVRGAPGTGKTTLALELLLAYPGRKVYVSARVAGRELRQDFPWIGTVGDSGLEIVEGAVQGTRITHTARAMEQAAQLLTDTASEAKASGLWLPQPVLDAISRTEDGARSMVVIDSWDALIEQYLGSVVGYEGHLPEREEIERILLGQLREGPTHLVLVLERETPSHLDYLVDGTLHAAIETYHERAERWIHLHKLRGVRIENANYPYTLEGARFQCASRLDEGRVLSLPQPDPEPAVRPGYLWPGSAGFAHHFGWLPLGRYTLIEADNDVPLDSLRCFLGPLLAAVAAIHGRTLFVLSPGTSPEQVWETYRGSMELERFVRDVRMVASVPLTHAPEGLERSILPTPPMREGTEGPRVPDGARFIRESGSGGVTTLSALWIDGLRALSSATGRPYTPESLAATVQSVFGQSQAHGVFIGTPDDPLTAAMRPLSPIRLELTARHGRLFAYGVQPRTPPLIVVGDAPDRPPRLLRMV